MILIDFPSYHQSLKLVLIKGKKYVFDPIRKKNILLQPEELVRQLVLAYLVTEKKYRPNQIRIEWGIKVNGMPRRCDIVIFDKQLQPFFLVECKATNILISQDTFDQIARYNMTLNVQYLMVTNGIDTYCCQMDYNNNTYNYLTEIPDNE
jgi:hypothetical protein